MTWHDQNRRDLLRGSKRRSSLVALRSEQVVVEKASRSLLSYGPKRRSRNLESALRILSSPFNPKRTAQEAGFRRTEEASSFERERGTSVVSSVTIPSEFDSATETELTSAEEIVLNARRKQAILMSILTKFQVQCRLHLKKKRSVEQAKQYCWTSQEGSEQKEAFAATSIQNWFRSHLIRQEYLQKKKLILFLQAQKRGIKIRLAYQLLLFSVTHVQAICRGFVVRNVLASLATDRMNVYKQHIFALWNIASTPLTYRAQFWKIVKVSTFLRLRVTEQEIVRLWKELKIQVPNDANGIGFASKRAGIELGSVHGNSYNIYRSTLKVRTSYFELHINLIHVCSILMLRSLSG